MISALAWSVTEMAVNLEGVMAARSASLLVMWADVSYTDNLDTLAFPLIKALAPAALTAETSRV